MLQDSVEGTMEAYEECIAAPPEMDLDIGIREPCKVKEISCRHWYIVAGSQFQIQVSKQYIESFVGNVA